MSKSLDYKGIVVVGSILIPILVALLYLIPKEGNDLETYAFLPKLNAVINSVTAVVLISAFLAVKYRSFVLHKQLMLSAVALSVLFLVGYVIYHATTPSTPFGGEGSIRIVYFTFLLSHIILAIVMVPMVLITLSRALSSKFDKHKKIARWTLPIWLYVSITGVIVYLMISPYY